MGRGEILKKFSARRQGAPRGHIPSESSRLGCSLAAKTYVLDVNAQTSPDARFRRQCADFACGKKQCGILLPVFRALVFGLALCFGESRRPVMNMFERR
jgi:hypothetical protein